MSYTALGVIIPVCIACIGGGVFSGKLLGKVGQIAEELRTLRETFGEIIRQLNDRVSNLEDHVWPRDRSRDDHARRE